MAVGTMPDATSDIAATASPSARARRSSARERRSLRRVSPAPRTTPPKPTANAISAATTFTGCEFSARIGRETPHVRRRPPPSGHQKRHLARYPARPAVAADWLMKPTCAGQVGSTPALLDFGPRGRLVGQIHRENPVSARIEAETTRTAFGLLEPFLALPRAFSGPLHTREVGGSKPPVPIFRDLNLANRTKLGTQSLICRPARLWAVRAGPDDRGTMRAAGAAAPRTHPEYDCAVLRVAGLPARPRSHFHASKRRLRVARYPTLRTRSESRTIPVVATRSPSRP
jgi:hypothetical protein